MSFKIGNIEIKNKVVLAPMAGICNSAFRKLVKDMGAGLIYTEMISAEALVRENKKTLDMLDLTYDEYPVVVQLFGSNREVLSKAAKFLYENYPKIGIIDINMGCPVPKVAIGSNSGSALLKDPNKIFEIVKAVVESVPIPVTVKIRSGWDEKTINAKEVAKIIEKAGASAIAVHPRTRAQGYSGKANWNIIKEVKEAVNIPVIGNGDINSCFDAERMLKETNCDAVMIGRGVLGNPWIIKECVEYLEKGILPKPIILEDKINMIKCHLDLLLKTKPYKVAMLEIRSHVAWYLKGLNNAKKIKEEVFKTKTHEELLELLDNYIKQNDI